MGTRHNAIEELTQPDWPNKWPLSHMPLLCIAGPGVSTIVLKPTVSFFPLLCQGVEQFEPDLRFQTPPFSFLRQDRSPPQSQLQVEWAHGYNGQVVNAVHWISVPG